MSDNLVFLIIIGILYAAMVACVIVYLLRLYKYIRTSFVKDAAGIMACILLFIKAFPQIMIGFFKFLFWSCVVVAGLGAFFIVLSFISNWWETVGDSTKQNWQIIWGVITIVGIQVWAISGLEKKIDSLRSEMRYLLGSRHDL